MLYQTISQSLIITFVSFSLTLAFMAIGSTLIDDNAVGLINNSLMSRIVPKSQLQQFNQTTAVVQPLESGGGGGDHFRHRRAHSAVPSASQVDNAKFNSEIPSVGGAGGVDATQSNKSQFNDTAAVSELENLLSTILKQTVLCSSSSKKCAQQANGTSRQVELTTAAPLLALNNWMRSDPLLSFMVADRRRDRDLLPSSRPSSVSTMEPITQSKHDVDALVTSNIGPSVHLVDEDHDHERLNKRQEQVATTTTTTTTAATPKQVAGSRQQRRTSAYSSYVNDLEDAKRAGEAHARPIGSIIKTSTAATSQIDSRPLKDSRAGEEELKREVVTSFVPATDLAMSLTSVIEQPAATNLAAAAAAATIQSYQSSINSLAQPSSWDAKNALFNRQFSQIIHSLNITLLQPTPSPIKKTMKFMHFG